MDPPPPPPPGSMPGSMPASGQPFLPPHLQAMMRQMQKRQPKLQQQVPAPPPQHQGGRGFRGGRGGRRGRGRGQGRGQRNDRQSQPHFKRKRGPSDDVRDASRFFLPSMLQDPWRHLAGAQSNGQEAAASTEGGEQLKRQEELRPRQVQAQRVREDGPGRVFFQPSFLEDPWMSLVR